MLNKSYFSFSMPLRFFFKLSLVYLFFYKTDPWAVVSPRPHAMLSFERKPVWMGLERLFHLVIQGLTRFDWSSPK